MKTAILFDSLALAARNLPEAEVAALAAVAKFMKTATFFDSLALAARNLSEAEVAAVAAVA